MRIACYGMILAMLGCSSTPTEMQPHESSIPDAETGYDAAPEAATEDSPVESDAGIGSDSSGDSVAMGELRIETGTDAEADGGTVNDSATLGDTMNAMLCCQLPIGTQGNSDGGTYTCLGWTGHVPWSCGNSDCTGRTCKEGESCHFGPMQNGTVVPCP
jgi:hypothetical protein